MQLTVPPEMTTAVTDGLFGLIAVFLAYRLSKTADGTSRTKIWQGVLYALGASAVLGVPAHAIFKIAGSTPPNLHAQTIYWIFLGLFLFCMATLLGAAVLYDILNRTSLTKITRAMAVIGIIFYIVYAVIALNKIIAGYFIVFVAYSGLIMLFALVSYIVLSLRKKNAGYGIICAAIIVALIGSVLQASRSISFTAVWLFDYNSVYHFFMIGSALLFYIGVKKSA